MIMESYKEQIDYIFSECYKILYESNPCRIGWDGHGIEIFTDKNISGLNPKAYSLYECYLSEQLVNTLFIIEDLWGAWIDTFLNGTTSIYNMLHVYTIENLERYIIEYTKAIKEAKEERDNFLKQFKN